MNITKYLTAAGVPENLHWAAIQNLQEAENKAKGLLLHKFKARVLNYFSLTKGMLWHHNRLLEIHPEKARKDVAPMLNITANGDNLDWLIQADGTSRPVEDQWLNPDPESAEYAYAVSKCYWAKGRHPRSPEARKAWYLRNAGEYEAYCRGAAVDLQNVRRWDANGVTVHECSGAWQIDTKDKVLGFIPVKVRVGYEISNLWRDGVQQWYPIPGYELRAPVTWSVLPGKA